MQLCRACGEEILPGRYALGFRLCLDCGEKQARSVKHTAMPMAKSNYVYVSPEACRDGYLASNGYASVKGNR